MTKRKTPLIALASLFLAGTLALGGISMAQSAPKVGPKVQAVTGPVFQVGTHRSKVLVFYEDKDSTKQNQALKDELARWKQTNRVEIPIIPVADVSGYDWWPARGVVEQAIRSESRKLGHPIYCDWDGAFGKTMGARKGVSNVYLLAPDGRVLFSHSGALPAPKRTELIRLLAP